MKSKVNMQKMKGGNIEFLVNFLPDLVCTYTYMPCLVQKGLKEALSSSFSGLIL